MPRTPLEGMARSKLTGLLAALRAPGDNTDLIRNKAISLLGHKPSTWDREGWLRTVLPEPWHTDKVMASLGGSSGANGQSDQEAGDSSGTSDAARAPRRQNRRGSHHGR